MSTLALASLLVGAASATVSRAVATAQSTNVLRYSVAVSTTERARVAVQVWEYGTASTTGWTTEYTATDARNGTVAVWGLKASTRYNYRVLVDPAAGANYTDARTRSFTTGALPANVPVLTATTYAGPPDLSYVLFHTRNTSAGESAIVISDPNGAVRWYQDVPSAGDSWAVSWYSEEENAIYGMVELD